MARVRNKLSLLVFPVDEVEAGVLVQTVGVAHATGGPAPQRSAISINVHPDVSLQPADVFHSAIVVLAVRDKPDDRGQAAHLPCLEVFCEEDVFFGEESGSALPAV